MMDAGPILFSANYIVTPLMSCPRGKIYRKPYTRTTPHGPTHVPGACITATSQSGLKRAPLDKVAIAAKKRSHKRAAAITRGPGSNTSRLGSCPKGQVKRDPYFRSAYTRADGTYVTRAVVPGTCIAATGRAKSTGKKGKQLFVLDEGVLEKYGYVNVRHMSAAARHAALNAALRDGIKPLPLFRHINALYVLNKIKDAELARIFAADRDYIKTTPAYKNRPTAS